MDHRSIPGCRHRGLCEYRRDRPHRRQRRDPYRAEHGRRHFRRDHVGSAGQRISGAPGPGIPSSALKDPRNILSKRNIYFDYDQFTVKEEYRPIVEAHAKYLQSNRSARAILQGNGDERGTREYNIALGQKRADAVKNMMLLLGAQEIQIETVSFGKEKPRREGHDEASWAENRRVDIVHAGE